MTLNNEQLLVLFNIPEGKENAISRTELAASVGYGDRLIRRIIAQLREQGYMIMNRQDGKGYYISNDPDEIEKQYRQDTARAMAILKRRKNMRRILKEAGRKV